MSLQAHEEQTSDRILSGAAAEALEEELGTSGIPDISRQAGTSSHVAGASGPSLGASGSSIAEMLREVEAYVGDWRGRGTDNALAKKSAAGLDMEDPMVGYQAYVSVSQRHLKQGLFANVIALPALPPCLSSLSYMTQ